MDLAAARVAIAAGAPSGVHGYARPPGLVGSLPAMIVGDPDTIEYHEARATRHEAIIPVRVIVPRSAEQDSTAELDTLISFGNLPATLEAIVSAEWDQLVVERLTGGYADFSNGNNIIGISADLTVRIIFTS